ncbi:MAG: hypothetical protein ACLU4P_00100 [Ruminococcus sp.]
MTWCLAITCGVGGGTGGHLLHTGYRSSSYRKWGSSTAGVVAKPFRFEARDTYEFNAPAGVEDLEGRLLILLIVSPE